MLQALLYDSGARALRPLDATQVAASTPQDGETTNGYRNGGFVRTRPQCRQGELLWVDITAPDESDYQLLAQRFDLHPMVVEDIKSREGRPKLHDYGDYLYVVFHALRYEAEHEENEAEQEADGGNAAARPAIHMCEIDVLVGPDYVVTLHPEPLQPFDDLRGRWERHPEMMQPGAAYLLYELMDEILDDYFPMLDALDERIDDFEDRLFMEFQEGLSADIFALKRCLVQIRRIAGPTRDVVNVLLRRDADSGSKHFAYFQDLYDHSVRIVDMVDTFRDILSGALDAYLAMASNRMNAVMKTLTAASIILLVPSLIAGIYGMNFEFMPELKNPNGYYIAIGMMIGVVLGLIAYFKSKQWL